MMLFITDSSDSCTPETERKHTGLVYSKREANRDARNFHDTFWCWGGHTAHHVQSGGEVRHHLLRKLFRLPRRRKALS